MRVHERDGEHPPRPALGKVRLPRAADLATLLKPGRSTPEVGADGVRRKEQ